MISLKAFWFYKINADIVKALGVATYCFHTIMYASHRLPALKGVSQFIVHWIVEDSIEWTLIGRAIVGVSIEYLSNAINSSRLGVLTPEIWMHLIIVAGNKNISNY